MAIAVFLLAWLAYAQPAGATEPATAGIEWIFEPDNPSAEALIGFRKPAPEVREVQQGFLWIDAEDFADYGGWWLDTQFVHLMGSGYLMANGICRPVEPASTEVVIPRRATYHLWVRARNWLPEHSPGRFRVAIDDREAQTVFGIAKSDRWVWQSGGRFELDAGPVQIELRDLTGQYGRCDAMILTTHADYVPPDDIREITTERARLTGLDLAPNAAGEYDVIVVGAGAAGCCAAIASARGGARTALVHNRPVLGGSASLELGVPLCGAAVGHQNAREGGITEEAGRIRTRFEFPKLSEPFRILAEREEKLSVFLNQHVFGVEMGEKTSIAAVKAVDTFTGAVSLYRGRVFIDCTGDGWLGYYAGADYRFGREGWQEFNEDLAPEQPDEITMSGCIMGNRALSYRAQRSEHAEPYEPPAWAIKLPSPEEFGRQIRHIASGEWWLEHPGTFDDLYDAERARDELIRITFGYWDYIKNKWPDRQQAARYRLTYVPIGDAKRETRRLMGDYILTQHDVLGGKVFPDRISYGGWSLDVHHPKGILSGTDGPFDCNPRVPLYTIPYRCLYSRNVENLLFAGRDVSVTHIALGSVRVQGTLSTLGQAAGTAAALAIDRNTTPRGVYANHVEELQQLLLKHDQYIPGLKNEDTADLARTARVSASSTALVERFEPDRARAGLADAHEFTTSRATMFPVGVDGRIENVYLCLKSTSGKAEDVTLHLRGSKQFADFSSEQDLASAVATVPAGKETWVRFSVAAEIDTPYAWVWLPKKSGVWWRLMTDAPKGSCRAWGGVSSPRPWSVIPSQFYACYTDPTQAMAIHCPPEDVLNGVSRIVGDELNRWSSNPDEPMPQWIELDFAAPRQFNTVMLTFDTNMNPRHKEMTSQFVPQCVRDYELAVKEGDDWRVVSKETDNFSRHRVHHFDPVVSSKLRLTVQATNGSPSAHVFEIRVYNE